MDRGVYIPLIIAAGGGGRGYSSQSETQLEQMDYDPSQPGRNGKSHSSGRQHKHSTLVCFSAVSLCEWMLLKKTVAHARHHLCRWNESFQGKRTDGVYISNYCLINIPPLCVRVCAQTQNSVIIEFCFRRQLGQSENPSFSLGWQLFYFNSF